MFNLGMEYDLLHVVSWDIRRYFYFYSPFVRTKKKSCHLHLRSVHCEKLIAIGLTYRFCAGQVAHHQTDILVSRSLLNKSFPFEILLHHCILRVIPSGCPLLGRERG